MPRKTTSAFATTSTSSRPMVPTSSIQPQNIAHLYAEQPFSQPIPSTQMGQFEIIRKDQVQCDAINSHPTSLPPLCIAAAAVTERCCEKRLGMVYYMARTSALRITMQSGKAENLPEQYHKVPQLVYVHKKWLEEDCAKWRGLSHSDRLEKLNARAQLPGRILVMPITLSYTGERYDSTSDDTTADDAVEINGYLDGTTGPLAALCIPDKAYLGWVRDMIPSMANKEDVKNDYRRAKVGTSGTASAKMPVWKVTGERRKMAEMKDWDNLVRQLHIMYEERRAGSVVFFEKVLNWYIDGEKALRELRGDKRAEDRLEDGNVELSDSDNNDRDNDT